jgi:hypothetical protein
MGCRTAATVLAPALASDRHTAPAPASEPSALRRWSSQRRSSQPGRRTPSGCLGTHSCPMREARSKQARCTAAPAQRQAFRPPPCRTARPSRRCRGTPSQWMRRSPAASRPAPCSPAAGQQAAVPRRRRRTPPRRLPRRDTRRLSRPSLRARRTPTRQRRAARRRRRCIAAATANAAQRSAPAASSPTAAAAAAAAWQPAAAGTR